MRRVAPLFQLIVFSLQMDPDKDFPEASKFLKRKSLEASALSCSRPGSPTRQAQPNDASSPAARSPVCVCVCVCVCAYFAPPSAPCPRRVLS